MQLALGTDQHLAQDPRVGAELHHAASLTRALGGGLGPALQPQRFRAGEQRVGDLHRGHPAAGQLYGTLELAPASARSPRRS